MLRETSGWRGRELDAGKFVGPRIVTPLHDDGLFALGQFAVAAAFGGQIDDHRSGRHAFDGIRRDEHRRRLPGMAAVVMHDVARAPRFGHQLALASVELFVLRLGVAAGVLGVAGFERHFTNRAPRLWICSFTAGRTS